MYPTGCSALNSIGSPKFTGQTPPNAYSVQQDTGSVTYGMHKVLTRILKPLVGKSPHYIRSTQDFVKQANKVTLQSGKCLSLCDVSALFTSVPMDLALDIIKGLLEQDNTLKERTVLPVKDIILLLGFCLHNTYFSFQGKFNEQVEGAAIGSQVSPIVANLYMDYFEQKALCTAIHPLGFGSGMWKTHLSSIGKSTNRTS